MKNYTVAYTPKTFASSVPGIMKTPAKQRRTKRIAAKVLKDLKKSYTKTMVRKTKKRKSSRPGSNSLFVGKFDKPYKKVSTVEKFLTNGFVVQLENTGTVVDPDVVGVAHSTYSHEGWARCLASVIIRKLIFRAVGANPATSTELLGLSCQSVIMTYSTNFSTLMQSVTHTYNGLTDTLKSVAATFSPIIEQAFGEGGSCFTLKEIIYVNLQAGYEYKMNLEDSRLVVYVKSALKIQNRTLSDGSSANTDQVDANPIKGYAVQCNGGIPNIRGVQITPPLSELDQVGRATITGSSLNPADREPFRRINFTNGKYERKLLLNPGHIKYSTITSYKSGYLNNIIKSVRAIPSTVGTLALKCAPGKSEAFMFEEVINTGADINMTLGYEQEIHVCMDLITGKKRAIRIEVANNPA